MKKLFLAAALVAPFSFAHAQEVHLGTVETWDIVRTSASACNMQSQFNDGTYIHLGADMADDTIWMSLANAEWEMIDGQIYPAELHIDSQAYEAEIVGFDTEGMNGLAFEIGNSDFITDLMKGRTLSVVEDGNVLMSYDLLGTMAAVPAIFECLGV